jgi:four helix bundle protein
MLPFRRLAVWQKAHALALALLADRLRGRTDSARSLADQIARSARSIGANIAEGCGSDTQAQFARYLSLALASAAELENHLLLARDAGLLDSAIGNSRLNQVIEVSKMLWALRSRVRADAKRQAHDS